MTNLLESCCRYTDIPNKNIPILEYILEYFFFVFFTHQETIKSQETPLIPCGNPQVLSSHLTDTEVIVVEGAAQVGTGTPSLDMEKT